MSVHIIVLVGLGHCQGVYIRRVWLVYFIVLFMGCLSTSPGHCKGVYIRRGRLVYVLVKGRRLGSQWAAREIWKLEQGILSLYSHPQLSFQ